eukprot:scaffold3540_cov379-Prasinococcus_capsulatus_cf.AAC.18
MAMRLKTSMAAAVARENDCCEATSSAPGASSKNTFLYIAIAASYAFRACMSATLSQAVEIVGMAPVLIASTKLCAIRTNMGPVRAVRFMNFGAERLKTRWHKIARPSLNSWRSFWGGSVSKCLS